MPNLFGAIVELDKNRDLGAEHLGDNRAEDVIHRSQRVAPVNVVLRTAHGSDKNDRSMFRARAFPDEGCGFDAVDYRHRDVQQNDSELLFQQPTQSFLARACLNNILPQPGKHRFEREKLVLAVIDQKDVHRLAARMGGSIELALVRQALLRGTRCSGGHNHGFHASLPLNDATITGERFAVALYPLAWTGNPRRRLRCTSPGPLSWL